MRINDVSVLSSTRPKLLARNCVLAIMLLRVVTCLVLSLRPIVTASPSVLSLDGSSWTLSNPTKSITVPAVVPGSVHLDLERAQIIGDPYYGMLASKAL